MRGRFTTPPNLTGNLRRFALPMVWSGASLRLGLGEVLACRFSPLMSGIMAVIDSRRALGQGVDEEAEADDDDADHCSEVSIIVRR
jgi:hypothetical protein